MTPNTPITTSRRHDVGGLGPLLAPRSIAGVRAYPTVGDVPEPIDLGVVVVPHAHVQGVAEQCCAAGVKSLVVISAGFKEVGEVGAARERALPTSSARRRRECGGA